VTGSGQSLGHSHFGQLKEHVLGIPGQLGTNLDLLLTQRRQRPVLDRIEQRQSPQEVAEVTREPVRNPGRLMKRPSRVSLVELTGP
tara:strand:- start:11238 stop:11495 length:258 start_codon:yes stop_codon:yes gene_type:complete